MTLFRTGEPRPIHFMGIAGAGMSALAILARHRGVAITGCDTDTSGTGADDLTALGIPRAVRSSAPVPEVSVSQPVMATPRCLASIARALIPAPAMPMKWMGRGSPVRNKVICGQLI